MCASCLVLVLLTASHVHDFKSLPISWPTYKDQGHFGESQKEVESLTVQICPDIDQQITKGKLQPAWARGLCFVLKKAINLLFIREVSIVKLASYHSWLYLIGCLHLITYLSSAYSPRGIHISVMSGRDVHSLNTMDFEVTVEWDFQGEVQHCRRYPLDQWQSRHANFNR